MMPAVRLVSATISLGAGIVNGALICKNFFLCIQMTVGIMKTESVFQFHPDSHGIRLDVYASERGVNHFNVEILNCKGENEDEVDARLVHVLRYVIDSTENCAERCSDDFVDGVHWRMQFLKKNRALEERYMLLEELLESKWKKGISDGIQQILELITYMTADGRGDEIAKLSADPAFLEEMLEKYHLTEDCESSN